MPPCIYLWKCVYTFQSMVERNTIFIFDKNRTYHKLCETYRARVTTPCVNVFFCTTYFLFETHFLNSPRILFSKMRVFETYFEMFKT